MISEQPFAEKKSMRVRGYQMSYIDEGNGVPIIFQHGNPTSSYLWRNVMPHLKGQGRLIALDFMGMGDSEKLPTSLGENRYSLAEQYEYFNDAINQLVGDEKVILVLHDSGSIVGFHWANMHRDRVIGIAYMESIVAPLQITDFPEAMQKPAENIDASSTESTLSYLPLMLLNEFLLKERDFTEAEKAMYLKPFEHSGEDCRPTISFDIPVVGVPFTPDYSIKWAQDYSAWMGENDLPKLLIRAEPGYLIRNRLYDIVKEWKNQHEVVVKGYHFIQETAPNEIGEAISNFVKTLNV